MGLPLSSIGFMILFITFKSVKNDEIETQISRILDNILHLNKRSCTAALIELEHLTGMNLRLTSQILHENYSPTITLVRPDQWEVILPSFRYKTCTINIVSGRASSIEKFIRTIWNWEMVGASYKYVFVVDEDSFEEMMKIKELLDIVHFVAIPIPTKEHINDSMKIFSLDPFGGIDGSRHTDLVTFWKKETSQFYERNLFPDRFKNLKGKTLICAYINAFPFFDQTMTPSTNETFRTGVDYEILTMLSTILNFKPIYIETVDGKFGARNATSNAFNGLVGMVQRREADLAVGAITKTYPREEVIDFTMGYFHTPTTFITRKPAPLPQWQAMYWPFETILWIAVIISIFGYLLIYFIVLKHSNGEKTLGFTNSSLNIWGSFFNQSIRHPKETSPRILMGAWFLYSMCIVASYGGSLVSFLTLPRVQKSVDTLEELIESDLKVVILNGSLHENLFKDSEDDIYKNVWNKFVDQDADTVSCLGFFQCMEYVVNNKGFGFIFDFDIMQATVETEFSDIYGQNDIHFAKAEFFFSQYAAILYRNSPILSKFDNMYGKVMASRVRRFTLGLLRLRQFGMINYWRELSMRNKRFQLAKIKKKEEIKEIIIPTGSNQVITLKHVQGIFFIYFIGIGISFFALGLEIVKLNQLKEFG